jgi:hypothetical protein
MTRTSKTRTAIFILFIQAGIFFLHAPRARSALANQAEKLNLRHKDIPVNHMMPDDETATGFTYALVPQRPIEARWVRFEITPQRTLTVSEVEVLDSIRFEPFDLRIALLDEG